MISSEEKPFSKAVEKFERLIQSVRNAEQKGERVDVVERDMLAQLLHIGFELMESYIARCGVGDLGRPVTASSGSSARPATY